MRLSAETTNSNHWQVSSIPRTTSLETKLSGKVARCQDPFLSSNIDLFSSWLTNSISRLISSWHLSILCCHCKDLFPLVGPYVHPKSDQTLSFYSNESPWEASEPEMGEEGTTDFAPTDAFLLWLFWKDEMRRRKARTNEPEYGTQGPQEE